MSPEGARHAIDNQVREILSNEPALSLRFDLTGRDISTFAIGGPLRALAEAGSVPALQRLVRVLKEHHLEYTVVGAGSNLLVDDQGIDRWVIRLGSGLKTLTISESEGSETIDITVGGAYPLMALSREMCARGFAGLAFAGGIPASLGGAVRMNAGAHGGEMSQLVEHVDVLRLDGELVRLPAEQMLFSYRHSSIEPSDIVVSATLQLKRSSPEQVQAQRAHCLEERRSRQPLSQPSAGSVFKNPYPGPSAGALIEQAGLKGQRIGNVEISTRHANWIVNPEKQGRAADVRELIQLCQDRVEQQFSVRLQPEIICLF